MAFLGRGKTVALAAALFLTTIGTAGCGAGGAPADASSSTDNVVAYGGQMIVPDLVFRGKDWGKPYGVRIRQERFPSGSEAFQALLAGDAAVSNGGSGRLITIAAQQPDAVQIVAKWQYGGSRYSVLTPPGSHVSSAADLKGKKVAVDTGSGAYTLFEKWLQDNGLKLSDVHVVQTSIDDVGAALQSGSADVGVAWEPTASLLVDKHIAQRLTTLQSAGQSPNFLLVNKAWAEGHHQQLVKFLKAAVAVGNFIEKSPDAAGRMAAEEAAKEGVQMPASALSDALQHIQMAPQVDQASLNELTGLAKQMVHDGTIPNVPDFNAMVDNSYLKEALAR